MSLDFMCDNDKAGFRNDQPINETNGNERNCCSWRVGTKILPKYVFFKVHNIEPEMQMFQKYLLSR